MCGLVGIAGTIENKHKDAFCDLLIYNIPRGKDSTGVFSVDRDVGRTNKDTYLMKAPVNAVDFMDMKGFDRAVNTIKFCIIGHGRAATVGKVNRTNAHPFEFSNIAGAHNGTLNWETMKDVPDADKFGTDSEALYAFINDVGFEEAITTIHGGAYALTWYDKRDHSINFWRNDQRPLCYSLVNDGKTIIWSSENDVLHAAAGRNGRNIETEGNTWWLPANEWYKFIIPEKSGDKFADPIIKAVKGKEVVQRTTGNYSAGQHFSGGPVGGSLVQLGSDSDKSSLKESKVVSIDRYKRGKRIGQMPAIEGWNGRKLCKTEYENLTGKTCAYSDEVIEFEDLLSRKQKIVFIDESRFVCAEYNSRMWHQWMQEEGVV